MQLKHIYYLFKNGYSILTQRLNLLPISHGGTFSLKLDNNRLIVTIASFTKDKTRKLQKVDDVEYIVITNKMKCS